MVPLTVTVPPDGQASVLVTPVTICGELLAAKLIKSIAGFSTLAEVASSVTPVTKLLEDDAVSFNASAPANAFALTAVELDDVMLDSVVVAGAAGRLHRSLLLRRR